MAGPLVHARAALLTLLAVTCFAVTSGCRSLSDGLGDDEPTDRAGTSVVDVGLETVGWSVYEGTASVLVRNDTDQTLRRADAVIQAFDRQDITVSTSSASSDQATCCAAMNVPPGGTYGFYFAVGDVGDEIDHLVVDYSDVAWSTVDPDAPTVTGEPVELTTYDSGAVVIADLVTTGAPVAQAVVQARLDDADGTFFAVVSGLWTCLSPDQPTRAEMELFHDVPAGTQIGAVDVYPITGGVDASTQDQPLCES